MAGDFGMYLLHAAAFTLVSLVVSAVFVRWLVERRKRAEEQARLQLAVLRDVAEGKPQPDTYRVVVFDVDAWRRVAEAGARIGLTHEDVLRYVEAKARVRTLGGWMDRMMARLRWSERAYVPNATDGQRLPPVQAPSPRRMRTAGGSPGNAAVDAILDHLREQDEEAERQRNR